MRLRLTFTHDVEDDCGEWANDVHRAYSGKRSLSLSEKADKEKEKGRSGHDLLRHLKANICRSFIWFSLLEFVEKHSIIFYNLLVGIADYCLF